MRLVAALKGNLEKYLKEELRDAELAVTRGVSNAGKRLKDDLRADVVLGGLGPRVARTWQNKTYPGGGRRSLSAAAAVFSKAPHIIESFDKGKVIRSRDGLWLAIPTDEAPKRGLGRKRISPSNFPENRYGPLRFVYRKSGPSLLVVDDQRQTKAGNYTRSRSKRALKTKRGLQTVVMFLLFKQVRMKRRLNVDRTVDAGARRVIRLIDEEFRRIDAVRK